MSADAVGSYVQVTATAPVTQAGVGDVKLQAMWERTVAI